MSEDIIRLRKRAEEAKLHLKVNISKRDEILKELKEKYKINSIEASLDVYEKTEKEIEAVNDQIDEVKTRIENSLRKFEMAINE